jgi:hyperosmotically inducible periplasmic protein
MKSTLTLALLAGTLALGLPACMNTSDRSAGRQIDDRIVNSKVKDALDDATVYKFPEVRVMTYAGVVQLSGFVATEDQKAQAAELARKVEGVHEVINNISIKPTATGHETGTSQPAKVDADVKADTNATTNKTGAPVRENK